MIQAITRYFKITSLLVTLSLFAPLCMAEWTGNLYFTDDTVWPSGRSGNYGIVKYFIDESKGEKIYLNVNVEVWAPGVDPNAIAVQAYTNVNRRDFAKLGESFVDVEANPANAYYQFYDMHYVGLHGNNFIYKTTVALSQAGAYRLTTRFKLPNKGWQWHNDFSTNGQLQRDAAIVVSPKKVLNLSIYEVNPIVVEATEGGTINQRSTFEDFTDHDDDGFDPFSIDYVRNTLGFNTMWMMPIFPNTDWRYNPSTSQWENQKHNGWPGSPYAAQDYWSVSEYLSNWGSREGAMDEFKYLMNYAEERDLNIIIDAAYNHSGKDTIFGQICAEKDEYGNDILPFCNENQKDWWVKVSAPNWTTKGANHREPAESEADSAWFAPADRADQTWYDAGIDWYFGDYSNLGSWTDPFGGLDGFNTEKDLYYSDLKTNHSAREVFQYFGELLPYWLRVTDYKLDGLRADFSQGLPSIAWEYIINKTRQKKWDFVFLAEVLDGDPVPYRINRIFDLITTVDHKLYTNMDAWSKDYFQSRSREEDKFGYNAAVMHNGTSHDEHRNVPWAQSDQYQWGTMARYAISAATYGVPMMYMGQNLKRLDRINFETAWEDLEWEWRNVDHHVDTYYGRINRARENNPAFQTTNSYYLTRKDTGAFDADVFGLARWDNSQTILAFVNLRNYAVGDKVFNFPGAVGLDTGKMYQAHDLLAADPNQPLWGDGISGADILNNDIYIKVNSPNQVNYLKIVEVAPPTGEITLNFSGVDATGLTVKVNNDFSYIVENNQLVFTELNNGIYEFVIRQIKNGLLYEGSITLEVTDQATPVVGTMDVQATPITEDIQRTVILMFGRTVVGQDMFMRGGIDWEYSKEVLGIDCGASPEDKWLCAIPISHNLFTTHSQRANDTMLDWYGAEEGQGNVQGSPLVWTTNNPDNPNKVSEIGYGYTPLNTYGDHYWMLDVDMDCTKTVDGWFEIKSYISNGPGWESNISQSGTPYDSINHMAQCGKVNVFKRNSNSASIFDF